MTENDLQIPGAPARFTRPHTIAVHLSEKEFQGLQAYAAAKQMPAALVLSLALRVLDLVEQTDGAYETIQALRPCLGPFGCMGDEG